MKRLKRFPTMLTDEQHESLGKIADFDNISIAEVIRHAVDEYLAKPESINTIAMGDALDAKRKELKSE